MDFMKIISDFITVVGAIAAPVVASLICAILIKVAKKYDLHITAEMQARVETIVTNLVLQVEEWGASKIKAGAVVTAQDKAQRYLALAADALPGVTPEEATALAQQELAKLGIGASGFLQALKQASLNEQ